MSAGISVPIGFEQEPDASLGLVQPGLDQARGGDSGGERGCGARHAGIEQPRGECPEVCAARGNIVLKCERRETSFHFTLPLASEHRELRLYSLLVVENSDKDGAPWTLDSLASARWARGSPRICSRPATRFA